jgi:hypothetical protein
MKNVALLPATLLAAVALTGCGAAITPTPPARVTVTGGTITGKAMGGQQPVQSGSVVLWAANETSYDGPVTQLISTSGTTVGTTTPVNTGSDGSFNISSDFVCPISAPDTPVYLTIMGGNTSSTANANLGLMLALGPCDQLHTIPYISVNEITTVASVYALAHFMSDYQHVGTSSTNLTGLANAFATVNKLVNITTGLPVNTTLPTGSTLPADEIYALANILATCVNSAGNTGPSSNCGELFGYTTYSTPPTNTIDSALQIAQNPASNVHNLWGLINATGAAFTTNEAEPTSWTIAINYTGGGMDHPQGIAVDGSGNVWVPNPGVNTAASGVTLLNNSTATLTSIKSATLLNRPSALAIDVNGTAWVTNTGNSSLTEISPSGTVGSSFTGNGLSAPSGIAIDSQGDIWVSNSGANSVSVFLNAGVAAETFNDVGGLATPVGIAVNPQ